MPFTKALGGAPASLNVWWRLSPAGDGQWQKWQSDTNSRVGLVNIHEPMRLQSDRGHLCDKNQEATITIRTITTN